VVLLSRSHRSDRCEAPVRPVRAWTDSCLGFELVQVRGLFLVVMVLVVGLERVQVVNLLGVLLLVLNTGIEGVVALSWRGRTSHGLSCVDLVPL
jgi:diacylglycerol kinase